jgi:hypothetical protein
VVPADARIQESVIAVSDSLRLCADRQLASPFQALDRSHSPTVIGKIRHLYAMTTQKRLKTSP